MLNNNNNLTLQCNLLCSSFAGFYLLSFGPLTNPKLSGQTPARTRTEIVASTFGTNEWRTNYSSDLMPLLDLE